MTQEEFFKKIINNNSGRIYRICNRYFDSQADALDAYQDILLKIWLNLGKFRGEANISTWIFRIAVNVCLTTLKTSKKKLIQLVPDPVTVTHELIVDETEENQEEDMKMQFFRQFFCRLSSADRILVNLYLEDLTTAEIASVTGLSESNVRTRIHRIKKQINKAWENHGT